MKKCSFYTHLFCCTETRWLLSAQLPFELPAQMLVQLLLELEQNLLVQNVIELEFELSRLYMKQLTVILRCWMLNGSISQVMTQFTIISIFVFVWFCKKKKLCNGFRDFAFFGVFTWFSFFEPIKISSTKFLQPFQPTFPQIYFIKLKFRQHFCTAISQSTYL